MAAPVGRGVDPDDLVDGVAVRREAVGSDSGSRAAVARIEGVGAEAAARRGCGQAAAGRRVLDILLARVVVDGLDLGAGSRWGSGGRRPVLKNEYPTKNLNSTSRLLVGCHTQASGYFWRGNTTVLRRAGPARSIGAKLPYSEKTR